MQQRDSVQNNNNIQEINHEYLIKIILLGDKEVGKSNILSKFIRNEFKLESKNTIGVEYGIRNVQIQNTDNYIQVQLWDTAGLENFKSISKSYYQKALGVILCFDITNKKTFNNLDIWLKEIKNQCDKNVKITIVGNKADLLYQIDVPLEEVNIWKESNKFNYKYFQISSRTGANIEEAIQDNIQQIYEMLINPKYILDQPHIRNKSEYLKLRLQEDESKNRTTCQNYCYEKYK